MNDDFLANLDQAQQEKHVPKPRSGEPQFRRALRATRGEVSEASGKSGTMHGRYQQVTFRIDPIIVDEIDALADEMRPHGISKAAVKRWIIDMGILAARQGARPELVKHDKWEVRSPLE